jgi:hypothetical protein
VITCIVIQALDRKRQNPVQNRLKRGSLPFHRRLLEAFEKGVGQGMLPSAKAVEAAETALELAINRYKAGIATYLEVITAQSVALTAEKTAVDLLTRKMTAAVLLIKALGGGWLSA